MLHIMLKDRETNDDIIFFPAIECGPGTIINHYSDMIECPKILDVVVFPNLEHPQWMNYINRFKMDMNNQVTSGKWDDNIKRFDVSQLGNKIDYRSRLIGVIYTPLYRNLIISDSNGVGYSIVSLTDLEYCLTSSQRLDIMLNAYIRMNYFEGVMSIEELIPNVIKLYNEHSPYRIEKLLGHYVPKFLLERADQPTNTREGFDPFKYMFDDKGDPYLLFDHKNATLKDYAEIRHDYLVEQSKKVETSKPKKKRVSRKKKQGEK